MKIYKYAKRLLAELLLQGLSWKGLLYLCVMWCVCVVWCVCDGVNISEMVGVIFHSLSNGIINCQNIVNELNIWIVLHFTTSYWDRVAALHNWSSLILNWNKLYLFPLFSSVKNNIHIFMDCLWTVLVIFYFLQIWCYSLPTHYLMYQSSIFFSLYDSFCINVYQSIIHVLLNFLIISLR